MKLTCRQCSRVIFSAPRILEGKTFCDNDFCLEEFWKVEHGIYRHAKYDFPDFNATYPSFRDRLGDAPIRDDCERYVRGADVAAVDSFLLGVTQELEFLGLLPVDFSISRSALRTTSLDEL